MSLNTNKSRFCAVVRSKAWLKSIKKFQIAELIKNYILNIRDHKRKILNFN